MSPANAHVPAIVRKEIWCCIAVRMLAIIFKESKMAIRASNNKMFDYYHGTDTIWAHIHILLKGDGYYKEVVKINGIPTVNDNTTLQTNLCINKTRFY